MTLFLLFDIEVLLLWPLAVILPFVGVYGFWVAVAFFGVLTLGFVVELASGALSFAKESPLILSGNGPPYPYSVSLCFHSLHSGPLPPQLQWAGFMSSGAEE